ncbi:MAG TPA: polymer-forming cytoskeletal protein [Williamwhitmania sp.]|nr:polymer-forming cytoskeletal protein [Williamwhitmania sp.]
MAKYNETETISANINLIGGGTEITGDINSNGDLRIDGILTGNITTKGKVVVGETGRIKGEISCKNADVSGSVEGKISVIDLLALKSSSRVIGDITTGKFSVEPGARFTGYCNMTDTDIAQNIFTGEISKKENDTM